MKEIGVADLTAAYGARTVLHGVSLRLETGEVVGLTGASGCGKTTLGRVMAGVGGEELRVVSGGVRRQGRAVYVPQEPALWLSPYLQVGGQVLDCAVGADRAEVLGLFRRLGLEDAERVFAAYPHELSGGQLQRVAWAQAWIGAPDFVVADEPTVALDAVLQREVMALALEQVQARGVGLLWISHDLNLLRGLGGRVVMMMEGAVLPDGHPEIARQVEAWR